MRKIIVLLLTLALSVIVVTGCAKNKSNGQKQQASTQTTQTTQTPNQKQTQANINTTGNASKIKIDKNAAYTDKEHVAAYINEFAKLPHNYITKGEAQKLGWQTKGTLDKVAPGKSIGGDRYGNYEGRVPSKNGRTWKECDIDYVKGSRNAKRIVYSNDGLIYYTNDHYKTFTKLYGK
ncbi:MAG: ribonuclease domain-containing protein [Phascolarctobacterium sp.]|nr:ribonuclease domain-containing protein [Phascolarctobacterium sp.]